MHCVTCMERDRVEKFGGNLVHGVRYCDAHAPADFMPSARKQVSARKNFKARGPSADAARSFSESKSELKRKAYEYLKDRAGTADEIARALGVDITSIRPRLTDLKDEGKIAPSRVRRRSDMGTTSGVWVLAARLKEFEEAHGLRRQERAA